MKYKQKYFFKSHFQYLFQATENSTSHSEFSRGKILSTTSEPSTTTPAAFCKASVAKKLAFFRANVNSADEGIDDFSIETDVNGKAQQYPHR